MSQLQEVHRAELQQKDAQHMRAVHQLEERQRQGEVELREELQQKKVRLQQQNEELQLKNSDMGRLRSENERLQVRARRGLHVASFQATPSFSVLQAEP